MFTPQLNLFRDRRPTPRLSIGPSPALLTDARFIGNPIDFVVFDGYTQVKDEKGDTISVVLVEVKKGKGKLTREEGLIKKAVEEGRVSWRTIFLKDEELEEGPV